MDMLERLGLRLPDCRDELLMQELLDTAAGMICAYTGCEQVPDVLQAAQLEIAAILFNRMGMEGEKQHDEGDVRRSADSLPEFIRRQLNPFRRAKAVEM